MRGIGALVIKKADAVRRRMKSKLYSCIGGSQCFYHTYIGMLIEGGLLRDNIMQTLIQGKRWFVLLCDI